MDADNVVETAEKKVPPELVLLVELELEFEVEMDGRLERLDAEVDVGFTDMEAGLVIELDPELLDETVDEVSENDVKKEEVWPVAVVDEDPEPSWLSEVVVVAALSRLVGC